MTDQLAEMIARANLHNDPLRFVLEHMDSQIANLQAIAAREPMTEAELARLTRAAAIGAHANVVAMIRATDRQTYWIRMGVCVAGIIAAAGAGYLVR